MTRQTFTAGTLVKIVGHMPETGQIMRWSKINGPRQAAPGYHKVRFDADGAVLLVHESALLALVD